MLCIIKILFAIIDNPAACLCYLSESFNSAAALQLILIYYLGGKYPDLH